MRSALVISMAVSLLLLSGCTGGEPESAHREGSSDVVGKERGIVLTQENFAEEIVAAQREVGTVQVATSSEIGGQALSMEGWAILDQDPASAAAQLTMELSGMGDGRMDLRMVNRVVYANLGQMTEDRFYKIDPDDDSDPLAGRFVDMLEQADPVTQMKLIGDSTTEFAEGGDGGEIDGVRTVRYVLSVDPVAMYEAQGVGADQMVELPDVLEYVLYVGRDLLPRRLEVEIPGVGTSKVEWAAWGEEVSIDVPDEDSITDEAPPVA